MTVTWRQHGRDIWAHAGALLYDPFLRLGEHRGMRACRAQLLANAHGRVLEIGAGTGLNLEHYPAGLTELVLAEPVEPVMRRLVERARRTSVPARISVAPAEHLPFPDGTFDTVVSTLTLCTVSEPERALNELRRVMRPTGRLLFCEHVQSDSPRLRRWQHRLRPVWAMFAQGCQCDRQTLDLIASTFHVESLEHHTWRGMPPLVRPLIVGRAAIATEPSGPAVLRQAQAHVAASCGTSSRR
jgi:SAM-dependent methyltransferase